MRKKKLLRLQVYTLWRSNTVVSGNLVCNKKNSPNQLHCHPALRSTVSWGITGNRSEGSHMTASRAHLGNRLQQLRASHACWGLARKWQWGKKGNSETENKTYGRVQLFPAFTAISLKLAITELLRGSQIAMNFR